MVNQPVSGLDVKGSAADWLAAVRTEPEPRTLQHHNTEVQQRVCKSDQLQLLPNNCAIYSETVPSSGRMRSLHLSLPFLHLFSEAQMENETNLNQSGVYLKGNK